MLTLNDVIYAKSDKGKVILHAPFQRTYLEYGSGDATEVKTSKVNSKKDDGSNEVLTMEITVPSGNESKENEDILMGDAINAMKDKFFPADPNGSRKAILKLLSYASNGYNLDMRKEAAPTKEVKAKPISEDAAFTKSAQSLVRGGLFPDMETALAFVKSAKKAAA